MIGLTRSLTTAGAAHGIMVNAVAPAAFTRMAGETAGAESSDPVATRMAPELVAPLVAFLAHESCPVSGEIYTAGAGRFARIFIASTEGYVHPTPDPTIEDVVRTLGDDQRRDGVLRPARPHGLVRSVHGAPAPGRGTR